MPIISATRETVSNDDSHVHCRTYVQKQYGSVFVEMISERDLEDLFPSLSESVSVATTDSSGSSTDGDDTSEDELDVLLKSYFGDNNPEKTRSLQSLRRDGVCNIRKRRDVIPPNQSTLNPDHKRVKRCIS